MRFVPLLLAATTATDRSVSVFEPVSPPAEWIRYLLYFLLAVVGVIFVIVEVVLLYSIIHFRRKPADPNEPPQVYGSAPIEIAWTVAPALVVFLLILVIIRTEYEIRIDPAHPPDGAEPLYVTVVGHQWWWEYRYHDGWHEDFGSTTPVCVTANELHVPASDGVARPVYLRLESADVCHSYWVPRLAGKTDVIPNHPNSMWFQTSRPDLYLGQCAEYCGTQHANMLLRVYVEPKSDFDAWLANEQKPAVEEPAFAEGKKIFLSQACVNCHTITGTIAKGKFGPDLTHVGSRKTLAAGVVDNTEANLRQWVKDPQKVKPGCLMPAMGLTDRDVDLVVGYLRSLK